MPQWIGMAIRGSRSRQRLCGAPRVEMTRAELRSPAPDRKERDVEALRELGHAGEEVGVAREVGARAAGREQVAEGGRLRAEDASAAAVRRMGGSDGHPLDPELVAFLDLGNSLEALAPQQPARAARNDDLRGASEAGERAEIEVVVVEVRYESRIDLSEQLPGGGGDAAKVRHPGT